MICVVVMSHPTCYIDRDPGVGDWTNPCAAQFTEGNVLSHEAIVATQKAALGSAMTAPHTDGHDTALLASILSSLQDDKAEAIVTIDLKGRSEIADHMVVCEGRSSRQVAAIAEKLVDRLKQDHGVFCRVEGKQTGDWVLIDAGDAIVHVFRPEVREFYQLEKMWLPADDPMLVAADQPAS